LDLVIRHFPGTPAAAAAERLLSENTTREQERSGRSSLIVFNTLYGAFLGVAIPAALGAESPAPYGAGLLIGAPLGFLGTKAFVERFPMTSGQATLTGFGARWGTWQGIGWREVFDLGDRTIVECYPGDGCYEWESESDRAPFTAAIVGGLSGLATGAILAQKINPSHGAATMVEQGALWGTWYGLATSALIDIDYSGDEILAWTLMGGNVGLFVSALATRSWKIGAGRARIISAAGLPGGVAGLGLDLLAEVDDEQAAILIPMLTSLGGLVTGAILTQKFESGTPASENQPMQTGFVNVSGGSWSLGIPALEPTLLTRVDRLRGMRSTLGAKISVFSATF
jgi:hypothetical protein